MTLERYFSRFRTGVVGIQQTIKTPFGRKPLLYADWTASGRLYQPIEEKLLKTFGPLVGNTHTEDTATGTAMTRAYHQAREIIKRHVNADQNDALVACGSGMTGAVNALQTILGLKLHERLIPFANILTSERPVVFITHMEHHSNQTSWLETICDVEIIPPGNNGLVDVRELKKLLAQHKNRKTKIAAVSAGSNVTGIQPPIHAIAKLMHQQGGLCFVDYACAAPYVAINMHPRSRAEKLDAIYFSPHKFLGGPGAPGILIFDARLAHNRTPHRPGGGTVLWTNPWGGRHYLENIEDREDGGTPPFLGLIKAALAIKLKEQMGVKQILAREKEILNKALSQLEKMPGVEILAGSHKDRLAVASFNIKNLHYNLVCRLLNDRFGIQTRAGCACAGTYGHYLFHVDKKQSKAITDALDHGDWSKKPGFVRISLHPIMTNKEVNAICEAISHVALHGKTWAADYLYDSKTNEFRHKKTNPENLDLQHAFTF